MKSSSRLSRTSRRLTPSPAMVVAIMALIVALSGSAYAAAKINGKNIKASTVTGKQIKNSSLTGSDIKNGSVKSSDIGNGSVNSAKITDGSVGAGDLAPGAVAAYFGANTSTIDSLPNAVATYTPVLTKTLPAGKYVVTSNVGVSLLGSSTDFAVNAQCRAKLPDNSILDTGQAHGQADVVIPFVGAAAIVNTPLSFSLDTTGTTVTVECSTGYDSDGSGIAESTSVSTGNARLTAIQVSSIG